MADSGASINVLDEEDYRKLPKSAKLEQSGVKIFAYQSTNPLQVLGKFTAITASTTKNISARFYVVKGSGGSLLSWKTSQELNLLQTVKQVTEKTPQGKLKNYQIKLHIDENTPPVAQPHRRVPFHVRKQLGEQLQRDEELGVIERIEGPTTSG
ncbi:uncharacterized protein LOC116619712 [Nematostella vectensis]|uniref:uncharacterized protein LOC116619712 n=1 Tax=Nematostella vectensis TaxID=45351 RepID=UPI00139059E0|nr:uncharacterized protein LOC116619712 [Nematostella vectensis]